VELLLTIVSLLVGYIIPSTDDIKVLTLSILLILYVTYKLYRYSKKVSDLFFIRPVVLCSIYIFLFVLGGIPNVINFFTGFSSMDDLNSSIRVYSSFFVKMMVLVNIACAFFWFGFQSQVGIMLYNSYKRISLFDKILTSDINQTKFLFVFAFAYLIKFYLLFIGLFGRIISDEYINEQGYQDGAQLRVFSDFSTVVFFLCSIRWLHNKNKINSIYFILSFILEIAFGFISTSRGQFILPFLVLVVTTYYVNKKVPTFAVLMFIISIYASFTLVLDFKNFSLTDQAKNKDTFILLEEYRNEQYRSSNGESSNVLAQFTNRVNSMPMGAMAIKYVDDGESVNSIAPNIIFSMLRSPYDAFIPKFIQGTPEFSWGYWFKNEVLRYQRESIYSIAMTPVGYFYLGGGFILVFIGFFIYGILVRLNDCFLFQRTAFNLILYISVLSLMFLNEGVFNGILINLIRYLFTFPILFWLAFGNTSSNKMKQ
jgi:hypothetical protein